MQGVLLYASPRNAKYIAPRLSCAYIFTLACSFIVILGPFFMCYSHHHTDGVEIGESGFWLKYNSYREKPLVKFQYKLILALDIIKTKTLDGEKVRKELFFSTFNEGNKLRSETFRSATVIVDENDQDMDGLTDTFHVNAKIPMTRDEEVYGIQSLLFFEFQLQNHVKLKMDSVIFSEKHSGLPGQQYETHGDISFHQGIPIRINEKSSNLHPKKLIEAEKIPDRVDETTIKNIMKKSLGRMFSTNYVERYSSWAHNPLVGISDHEQDKVDNEADQKQSSFDFQITVDVPVQEVVYKPALSEMLSEAWTRYLSILVVWFYLVKCFCSFVFTNQLVTTTVKVD